MRPDVLASATHRHRGVAHDPLARVVDVGARAEVHHCVSAPDGSPVPKNITSPHSSNTLIIVKGNTLGACALRTLLGHTNACSFTFSLG